MLNRFSMCGLIWVPRPRKNRHCDTGAQLESGGVFGRQQQWQKRIVVDFAGPAGVVALSLERARQFRHPSEVGEDAPVDPEAGRQRGAHTCEATVSYSVGSMSAVPRAAKAMSHQLLRYDSVIAMRELSHVRIRPSGTKRRNT
jgi:hypothetical protein